MSTAVETQEISSTEHTAAKALSFIPVVGPILAGIANSVLSIFGASHSAAVQKEAATINQVMPNFYSQVQTVIAAANEDAITPSEAIADLTAIQAAYYAGVASIIKQNGKCLPVGGGCAYSSNGQPTTNCASGSTCNAACSIGCTLVTPGIAALIAIIEKGGGTFTFHSMPANGAISAQPAVTVTYKAPGVLTKFEHYLDLIEAKL